MSWRPKLRLNRIKEVDYNSELFFFFIRNEEDYINIRTNTGEIKETRERECAFRRQKCSV